MDKKETYMWGTLLALVREQLAAIDKQVQGRLGMWGKARVGSRNREMRKFLFALLERKSQTHRSMALEAIRADLEFIETDQTTWDDITQAETEYVRNILASLD